MRKIIVILFCLLTAITVKAQKQFKTIAPQQPVVLDEAFQVQYIVEDGAKAGNFATPVFLGFRIVSGPNIYYGSVKEGSVTRQSKNFVFTLVATKPGKLIIPGALIYIDGRPLKSNSSFVEVISKENAAKPFDKAATVSSDYFLRPGENVQDKIKNNLFVKVLVDKRTCFVGEAVLATFKLYSRLQSKSDIVKNPGFYGFTVYDMVNLADKQVATETVNGKPFDVHTIRKVQLYPLQSGVFTIDAMEVINKVEFSRSIVNKKTEQEIIEGVLVKESGEKNEGTEEFESSMSTEPVMIKVKPLPANKPVSFNGATGLFTISARATKNKLSEKQTDILEITISGKGNFVQINAPEVSWPAGIEAFEPSINDLLGKSSSPLACSRTYRYPFVSSTPGTYVIPPLKFSFFNPDSGHYKTIATVAVQVSVQDNIKIAENAPVKKEVEKTKDYTYWVTGSMVLALLGVLLYFIKNKKTNTQRLQTTRKKAGEISVKEALLQASILINAEDSMFYGSVRNIVWNFLGNYFTLSGSEMSKQNIITRLKTWGVDEKLITEIQDILQQCETGMFTGVRPEANKKLLLEKSEKLLDKLNISLL